MPCTPCTVLHVLMEPHLISCYVLYSLVYTGSLELIHWGLAGFNVTWQCYNQTPIQMVSALNFKKQEGRYFGTYDALSLLNRSWRSRLTAWKWFWLCHPGPYSCFQPAPLERFFNYWATIEHPQRWGADYSENGHFRTFTLDFIMCEMCSGQLDVWLLSAIVSLAGIKKMVWPRKKNIMI